MTDVKVRITTEDKTGPGTKSAADNYRGLGAKVNEVAKEFTGFDLAQIGLAGSMVGLTKHVMDVGREFTGYIEQMDKLSQQTGMTADETSRLIQVADDFKVSQEAMTGAMTMAIQNGYQPSVEFMAKLADEVNGMSNQVEKTNRLQEIFGKQWTEIVPLLSAGGDAIRSNAAGLADGLVVTKEMVDQNRQLQSSLDNLGDAWQALEFSLAKSVFPRIAADMQVLAGNIDDLSSGEKNLFQVLVDNQKQYDLNDRIIKSMTDETYNWSDSQREAVKAAQYTTKATVDSTKAAAEHTAAMNRAQKEESESIRLWGTAADRMKDQASAYGDLISLTKAAQEAQEDFNTSYGDKATGALEKYAGQGRKYREGLAIIDKTLGGSRAEAYDNQKAMEKLSREFASGAITGEQYAQKLEGLKPAYEALDQKLEETKQAFMDAEGAWNSFYSGLAEADGSHFSVSVDVSYNRGGGNSQGQGGGGGVNTPTGEAGWTPRAAGGPVSAGNPVTVGEMGWETFVPASNGWILTHEEAKNILSRQRGDSGGNAPIVVNNYVYETADWERGAYKVVNVLSRRKR